MKKNNNNNNVTAKMVEEALEDIMFSKPKKGSKEVDTTIYVYQDEKQLSFKLSPVLYTGLGGFINFYEIMNGLLQLSPIEFNGVVLDKDQRATFWKEFERIKEHYKIND